MCSSDLAQKERLKAQRELVLENPVQNIENTEELEHEGMSMQQQM